MKVLVRYLHERLLFRISASPYKSHFLLKGSSLLYALDGFNPSLTFNYPFFLLSSPLRFSFAVLCTTNFSRFWFFWMASFCTLVVHKYHPRIYSARCKASCEPSLQGRWWLPWWPPSAWIASGQSLSKSRSLQFAWVCSVWCWLSSMKAGRGRGGHQTGRPSCDVPDAGSGRSSAGGWYYEKLLINTNYVKHIVMRSESPCQ